MRADVEVLCAQHTATSLDHAAFRQSLTKLTRKRLILADTSSMWRVEPDFDEKTLEDGAEKFLRSTECLASLRIDAGAYVLEKTTTVGVAGAGRWSRPDFALAAVRRFKYDPRKHLDVFSFELKNRRGADLVAVHETLAHSRFSHYAYLVCPRSVLEPTQTNLLRQACMDHGVGLITFDLEAADDGSAVQSSFRFDVSPNRRAPDPSDIDRHLDARLSSANQLALLKMAGHR
jgi:hypothetical protein